MESQDRKVTTMLLYESKNDMPDGFKYWSNSCGDTFNDGRCVDEKDLPHELQRALNELWSDGMYVMRLYLAEFNGVYGVSVQAEYENYDGGKCSPELSTYAHDKAIEISNIYPEYDILFGDNAEEWSDGTTDTIVAIFMPWDTSVEKFEEVCKYFDSMCYDI